MFDHYVTFSKQIKSLRFAVQWIRFTYRLNRFLQLSKTLSGRNWIAFEDKNLRKFISNGSVNSKRDYHYLGVCGFVFRKLQMPHGEVYCVSKISRMSSWRKVLHPAHGITLKTYFSSNILVVGHDMVDRPYKFSVTFTEALFFVSIEKSQIRYF